MRDSLRNRAANVCGIAAAGVIAFYSVWGVILVAYGILEMLARLLVPD